MDTEVLIVGAAPVALTLAIDLGKRGVRCILIEKNDAPLGYPKMERCNPRTMEIFRRLGLADTVRAAGYPPDWPVDTYLVFDLRRPPLFKMAHPTVAEAKARRDVTLDGSMPLEPYQIISQYTLEPLLKSIVERIPNVAVKFGHELESFAQDGRGVTARGRPQAGPQKGGAAGRLGGGAAAPSPPAPPPTTGPPPPPPATTIASTIIG